MAPDATPPRGATRYIQTSRGLLSYSQLAPLLVEQVLRVEREIASCTFAAQALSPELMRVWQQRFEQFGKPAL